MMENKRLAERLRHLVIFRSLREEPLVKALAELLAAEEGAAEAQFLDLAAELYPRGTDLARAVLDLLLTDDNLYVRDCAEGNQPGMVMRNWLEQELLALQESVRPSEEYRAMFGLSDALPDWTSAPLNFAEEYRRMLDSAPTTGYGVFSRYHVFSVSADGALVPVEHPDPQRLDELYGYETEKEKVLKNTEALLRGLRANNILLYGDAGTGKSSMVKAVLNEYGRRGLRLIQIEKDKLHYIPALLDHLSGNPLKFILFIDDLSFTSNDRDFTALKTVLEGSVAARSRNTVVYATSNRRHLVKETFQARQGDEVHLNDTLEEVASLSARFGIVITFGKPDKDLYLTLVSQLAEHYGLQQPENELLQGAEAYALRSGGRSPRVARQYVEYKIAMNS